MLFNSVTFAVFLVIVFFLYWFVANKSLKLQNVLLLFSSYYFYASWDWRFLFLLVFSTLLDYVTGIKIHGSKTSYQKKLWLWFSIFANLGILGVFKYFNFFAESLADTLDLFGFQVNTWTLKLMLPVGISFYTFHGLSYVIDIYKSRIQAERNFINYSVFVSFFPLLVAGPIERATHLLPQIQNKRNFDYSRAVDGLRQILWGLFKKVVIADQCAEYANLIFDNSEAYSGSTLLLGAVFFAFQIYGDFSGYSDIAIGTARLFGIDLLRNFAFPYFSRDIAEFWRRWHISLSAWFRDYVYIPLGGSHGSTWKKIRNVFIIFSITGFWHGANWTFIVWGLLNAVYYLPLLLTKKNKNNIQIAANGRLLPSLIDSLNILITFSLTTIAWIFFRSETITQAINYIAEIFSPSLFVRPSFGMGLSDSIPTMGFVIVLLIAEWIQRDKQHALQWNNWRVNRSIKWIFKILIIECILYEMLSGHSQEFIYFNF